MNALPRTIEKIPHGDQFTSCDYQELVDTDIYGASKDIKDLVRKGLARIRKKGGRVYEILELGAPIEFPSDFVPVYEHLKRHGQVTNRDVREVLGCDRDQAYRYLRNWAEQGLLELKGEERGAHYVIGMRLLENARL